ncbi:suppressor of fused domain protein [Streptomyces griseus]|uniref:Suppressor of fused-like domain-containing protein n=1 Tax=Streptomyces sp. CMC78 TaxID=3231512 RepID=A0AB33KLP0_9ACTN|nr:suppressor of fused domain protein [Streptomyces fimicarius]WTC88435.1 suppressor of fused domain protein [Streptomyces griseus]WTD68941.1 suppressor of fused domain protein [Streptomyces griseus]
MHDEFIRTAIATYTQLYGPPTRTRRFSRTEPPLLESAVVVYLPDEVDQKVPKDNLTSLWTAGFGAEAICADFRCELGMEVKGSLDEPSAGALAEALVELAEVPLESGNLFRNGQILTNVAIPVFPRFTTALLIDWESVYGFRFPEPLTEVGCLRVVPIFSAEAEFVESCATPGEGYRSLRNQGLNETDPERDSAVG